VTTIATSSPVYYKGRIYIGVSSGEENALVENPKYECCTFRGGVAAFDARTGALVWRFYTIPEPARDQGKDKNNRTVFGPSGAAVWSTVAIHPDAGRLYLTTGNQYTNPETKFSDAIIALDLDTGKVAWGYQAKFGDRFTTNCARGTSECGPDIDFGAIPISFKGPNGNRLIGAGQKSGTFYALDPKEGKLVWKTEVGTGRFAGQIVFGNATDGERVYVAISNAYKKIKQGSVAALDGATGKILWQTLSPDGFSNHGPVTVIGAGANRLVFAGSTGNFIRAYNAEDGKILWEFDTGGAVAGGPTVSEGVVYVGSGFGQFGFGKPNNKLYAFSIDGK
jgi:polyvinyl alcohol dehydrogenase (cytochrome)